MSPRKGLPAALAATLGATVIASLIHIAILDARQTRTAGDAVESVHTVRIDVLAVDARGTAISTLMPREFELREDGRLQALDDAQFLSNSPRLVAIYLDEYHITAGADADRAREALTAFVDRELGPRDLIVVMKPLDSLYSIRLTEDRDQARRIVASLEGRNGDYTARTSYERGFMAGTDTRIETERTQIAISALNALAEQMGSVNNLRKTLLVVTEGFEAPARRRGQEYLATIDSAIRSANRANVSIYPIDPRPASADAPGAALRSLASETNGAITVGPPGRPLRIDARADRIDEIEPGGWEIIDYKTGRVPSPKELDGLFAPQLLLEAAMAEQGGFEGIKGKARAVHLSYWQANGLGNGGEVKEIKGSEQLVPAMLALVAKMAEHFANPATPYAALPWPEFIPHFNDYAHLERIAEWSTAGGGEE